MSGRRRLPHIASLRKVRAVFRVAELSANTFVQPMKCVIVPVARKCDPATIELVRAYLSENLPEWRCFQVAGRGVYLGVAVGPLADANPAQPSSRRRALCADGGPHGPSCRLSSSVFRAPAPALWTFGCQLEYFIFLVRQCPWP